ncbi:hypothetical protein [Stenotrophomonas indicatrix]|uniref:hypothetical protein n=1 Tax=Stenotrophomonas indicatrix TaxID=2045451 RepID=UPI00215B1A24|nr:hypothetical protein [Stenotrophomonas indicatrix]MCR8715832.1 hypothetical protein [Stenotrophomonas indicatrix]
MGSDEGQLAMTQDHALGSVDRQRARLASGMSGRASTVLSHVAWLRPVQSASQWSLGTAGSRRVDARAQPWRDELKQGSTRVRMEVE